MFAGLTIPAVGQSSSPTVIDDWPNIAAPPAPTLSATSVSAGTTALLILDMQNNLVVAATRPRAAASVPQIAGLLARARAAGMLIVYSNAGNAGAADIVAPLAPTAGDPIVRSGVDKFFRTDLETILASHGITTVIVTGTAANGAVLFTATGAALRGLKVVVPVDGMSAEPEFVEQYVAYQLVNGPGTRSAVTLTRSDMIQISPR